MGGSFLNIFVKNEQRKKTKGVFYFMQDNELKELLEDNNYIIKQHIALCNECDKALPIRVYQRNLIALNEFKETSQQVKDQKLLTEKIEATKETKINNNEHNEQGISNVGVLLIESGLLVDKQVRHYKNYGFIAKCNEFINNYGEQRFKKVLTRVKQYKDNGIKINNIYAYISVALDTEIKNEVKANA